MTHQKNMKQAIRIILVATMVWMILYPPEARGDTSDTPAVSMTVPSVRSVSASTATMVFTPGLTEVLAGWTDPQDLDTTVSANVDWVMTITGSQANWTGPWLKPVGDIYWKYGAGSYAALTTSSVDVVSNGPVDGGIYTLSLKIALDLLTDEPGAYSYSYVVIELTAP